MTMFPVNNHLYCNKESEGRGFKFHVIVSVTFVRRCVDKLWKKSDHQTSEDLKRRDARKSRTKSGNTWQVIERTTKW